MTNKCGQTRQRTNNLRYELIWGGGCTPQVNWPPFITIHVGVSGVVTIRQTSGDGSHRTSAISYNRVAVRYSHHTPLQWAK